MVQKTDIRLLGSLFFEVNQVFQKYFEMFLYYQLYNILILSYLL